VFPVIKRKYSVPQPYPDPDQSSRHSHTLLLSYPCKIRWDLRFLRKMKMTVIWDVVLCSLVDIDRRFGGNYCLQHQGMLFWNVGQYLKDYTVQHPEDSHLLISPRDLFASDISHLFHQCYMSSSKESYWWGVVGPPPVCLFQKLEDHLLSAVRDCLFNIFAATFHVSAIRDASWYGDWTLKNTDALATIILTCYKGAMWLARQKHAKLR
jgi:hypothetical protein